MDFVFVPAGTYEQGTPGAIGPERSYTATISRNYFVSRTEVTQGQWTTATGGVNPSTFALDPNYPVQQVDWYSVVAYANWLSVNHGLSVCYTLVPSACADTVSDWANGDTSCTDATFADIMCTGYRLLTESEWERAARGGTTSTWYWGEASDDTTVNRYAWFRGSSGSQTPLVGGKQANAYGLYDMSGNVWEWVWDWYASAYPSGSATDYIGASSGAFRGLRGGSWNNWSSFLRSAFRFGNDPSSQNGLVGFRLARTAY
jgi:formylglycine-generating enzyme required for sulfatase activity